MSSLIFTANGISVMGKERARNLIRVSSPTLGLENADLSPNDVSEFVKEFKNNQKLVREDSDDGDTNIKRWTKAYGLGFVKSSLSTIGSWETMEVIVNTLDSAVRELNITESTADPMLAIKRYAAKAVKVVDAATADYQSAIASAIQKEVDALMSLVTLAESVSTVEFAGFINTKAEANGTDDFGYAKLRGQKDSKAVSVTEE